MTDEPKIQRCQLCDEPTERCEEDELIVEDCGAPLVVCWPCYEQVRQEQ